MFSLFCLDNLFLLIENPVQEQRDTQEPKHLLISFVFAVAVFTLIAQQALHAVFDNPCYPTLRTQYLLACRACKLMFVLCILKTTIIFQSENAAEKSCAISSANTYLIANDIKTLASSILNKQRNF